MHRFIYVVITPNLSDNIRFDWFDFFGDAIIYLYNITYVVKRYYIVKIIMRVINHIKSFVN
ncbi:ORF MSV178 hypothetical protein [Melanoplus sanguinipes entomopoxvirus]|uniref:Uncharacterized protein n=1 Tax=Melanoplus sanguinipes entomopoxvirus TaxID=83191 RepID=Q9YVR3_MSEPV|nr:ORF MSV178 hypothetical protein [Melanoplus sanguinipes entomopoxvirus]AAC97689.1 ORF MSV178 hypothetical protein [Melanoplus sanguinipes entomopoxvirus 'O']